MLGRRHWVMIALVVAVVGYGVYNMSSGGAARVQFSDRSTASGQDIATPLVGSVGVRKSSRRITLSLMLQDANGHGVRSVHLPNGKRPAAPSVEIFNADFQRVYSCTLKYG